MAHQHYIIISSRTFKSPQKKTHGLWGNWLLWRKTFFTFFLISKPWLTSFLLYYDFLLNYNSLPDRWAPPLRPHYHTSTRNLRIDFTKRWWAFSSLSNFLFTSSATMTHSFCDTVACCALVTLFRSFLIPCFYTLLSSWHTSSSLYVKCCVFHGKQNWRFDQTDLAATSVTNINWSPSQFNYNSCTNNESYQFLVS